MSEHNDIADLVKALGVDGGGDKLIDLLADAEVVDQGAGIDDCDVMDGGDFMEMDLPETDPVIVDVFDKGDVVSVIAPSKHFKTNIVMRFGMALAAGCKRFFGWSLGPRRKVLFVQCEVKREHFLRRMRRAGAATGMTAESIRGWFFIWNARGQEVTVEAIGTYAKQVGAEVIIVDSLYNIMTGDENSAEGVKPILQAFARIARETGATVIFTHHDKKGAAGDRAIEDRGSGSGVLGRAVDASITLTRHKDADDCIVVATMLRNYAPQEPFVLRMQDGDLVLADDMAAIARTSADRGSRYTDAARKVLEDNPDASDADIADVVDCDRSTIYRLRKRGLLHE